MATTITPADLNVTVNESIVINGQSMGSTNNIAISGIAEVFKRIVTVPVSEVTIYTTHDTDVAGSQFDDDLVKYVRITNKDGLNFINLRITDANNDEFIYKLNAGESFLLYSHNDVMSAAAAGSAGGPNASIGSVSAQADTDPVDVEIFIASI